MVKVSFYSETTDVILISSIDKLLDLGQTRVEESFTTSYEPISVQQASSLNLMVIASVPSTFTNPRIDVKISIEVIDLTTMTSGEVALMSIFIPLTILTFILTILHLK